MPLSRALNITIREASNPAARAQWTALHDDVVGGASLADAMAKFPRTFSTVYVAMVRAGELGGFLDVVLAQIADFQTRDQDLKGKVKAALVYPVVLACIATMVLIFLLTFFIPRFSQIFKDMHGTLPWLTTMIMAVSDALMHYGLYIAAAAAALYVGVKKVLATPGGQRWIERIMLSTPILGEVVARFALVRFSRMLGTLLSAGVQLIAALKVSKEAIGNQILSDTVARAIEEVQKARRCRRAFRSRKKLFPPSISEMVAVAEETARLGQGTDPHVVEPRIGPRPPVENAGRRGRTAAAVDHGGIDRNGGRGNAAADLQLTGIGALKVFSFQVSVFRI